MSRESEDHANACGRSARFICLAGLASPDTQAAAIISTPFYGYRPPAVELQNDYASRVS
jgi:hypothetical protein